MTRLLVFVSLVLLLGCPRPDPAPVAPVAPQIEAFTAMPTAVLAGESVTLSWGTRGADSVTVSELSLGEAGALEGSSGSLVVVPPAGGGVYVLTATNAAGLRARAVVSVQVEAARPVVFEALPARVPFGGSATLVWSARGARSVDLIDSEGMVLAEALPESGVFEVRPSRASRYRLRVDAQTLEKEVLVGPGIRRFTATPPAATPGSPIELSWETQNATALEVKTPGQPPLDVRDAGIDSGRLSVIMPTVPSSASVSFTLRVSASGEVAEQHLVVLASPTPRIITATAPRFVRAGSPFTLSWTSEGADLVRVTSGAVVVFEGPATGAVLVPAPAAETTYAVTAVQQRSGAVSPAASVVVEPVGVPQVVRFGASTPAIAQGGQPVTLSWEVRNARAVSLRDDRGELHRVVGPQAEQGTFVVFPNQAESTFSLEADNQAGDVVQAAPVRVTVASVGQVTIGPRRPVSTPVTLTGTTVMGGTTLRGFPTVVTNAPGEAFVDIALTGTPVAFSSADTASTLVDPGPFRTSLFGVPVIDPRVSISTNGWLVFGTSVVTGPSVPASPIGTTLNPLALAVFFGNLRLGGGGVQWQVDTVGSARRLIVQWTEVEEVAAMPGGPLTFQAQVFSTGKVVYAYRTVPPFTGPVTAGVVNATESGVLVATSSAPPSGTTFSFFSEVSLPVQAQVQPEPWTGFVSVPGGEVRVTVDPRLPVGALAITEANPVSSVAGGEWVEVENFEATPYDLSGWTVGSSPPLGTVVVPALGRVVLSANPQANDGVTTQATYGAPLFFPDGGGQVALAFQGVPTSRVTVTGLPDGGTLLSPGRSVRFDPPAPWLRFPTTTVTQAACEGTGSYGSAGQQGTPGQRHAWCFPYRLESDAGLPFQSIAMTGTQLLAGTSAAANEAIVTTTLPFPVRLGALSSATLSISTNGFLTLTPNTLPTPINRTLPTSGVPGTVAPFWDDLQGSTLPRSGLYVQANDPDGVPGSGDEVAIVSWEGFRTSATTVLALNFQVRFWANGDLTYHYGDLLGSSGTVHQGSSATAWLESPDARVAAVISVNSATAPGLRSNTSFRFRFVEAP
jgi:hypothetical protein